MKLNVEVVAIVDSMSKSVQAVTNSISVKPLVFIARSICGSSGAKFGRLLGIDSNRERARGKHIWWSVRGAGNRIPSGSPNRFPVSLFHIARERNARSAGSGRAKLRLSRGLPVGLAPQRHPTDSRTVNDSKDESWGVTSHAWSKRAAPVRTKPHPT